MQYLIRSIAEIGFVSFSLAFVRTWKVVRMRTGSSASAGLTALVAVLGFECANCSLVMAAKPGVDIENIRTAWMERQRRVRSARFEWQGTMVDQLPAFGEHNEKSQPEDGEFSSVKQRWSLVFDGQLIRYSSYGKKAVVRDAKSAFVDHPYTSVFGRENIWQHFGKCEQKEFEWHVPSGAIYSASDSGAIDEKQNYYMSPIVLHYRALDPSLSPIEGALTLSDKSGVVNGQRCLIVDENGKRKREYWVDPERCFAIRRCKEFSPYHRTKMWVQFDVAYKETPDHDCVPSGWKGSEVYVESGMLREAWDCTVTSYVLNLPVEPKEFEYEFPADTWVSDYRNGVKGYIVRRNGVRRAVLQAELQSGATYEELLRTESGMATGSTAEHHYIGRSTWSICATGAMVVVLLVVLLRRKLNVEA